MNNLETLKETLIKHNIDTEIFCDDNIYKIDISIMERQQVIDIFDSALGTSKLQKLNTLQLEHAIERLSQINDFQVKMLSITHINYEGDSIIVLYNLAMKDCLGLYQKSKLFSK